MPATASQMLELGTSAPNFALPDYGVAGDGRTVSLTDVAGAKATVVMFICNHCPFVKHVAGQLALMSADYSAKGVGFVAVNSNDINTHPADSPEKMTAEARAQGYAFPYLYDDSQEVAKAYRAACTPDFYVFDADLRLAYRGQLDGSRPNSPEAVTGSDVRAALDALLAGKRPSEDQKPSLGCNIKWTPGNEPEYRAR